jgi:leucyl-tRNA synthetase
VRLYTLFIGPPEKESEWSEEGVAGAYRFLNRVHELCARVVGVSGAEGPSDSPLRRLTHRSIERVTEDVARFHFHTAIAALMEFQKGIADALDEGGEAAGAVRGAVRTLLQLLHPVAPHLTEEWWHRLGERGFVIESRWPEFDAVLATSAGVTLVVQVNGKVRGRLELPRGASETEAMQALGGDDRIRPWLDGKQITRTVFVPDRLLNLVVR